MITGAFQGRTVKKVTHFNGNIKWIALEFEIGMAKDFVLVTIYYLCFGTEEEREKTVKPGGAGGGREQRKGNQLECVKASAGDLMFCLRGGCIIKTTEQESRHSIF